jgi:hypothetical protein
MKRIELDDLVRDMKKDVPDVDWKSVDEKLFARLEQEPRPLAGDEEETPESGGRVVWIGAALTLAAAAAALVFVHPGGASVDTHASLAQPAGELVHGDVAIGSNGAAPARTQLTPGDRIDVVDDVAYFESPGKVRWAAPRGSVLRVEHAASPLVLSLEHGAAEAQVTPVPSGEAFAVDVTASSGAVVRVAVHGTHLRVARAGDRVTIDLTEGVVSIGAPPRRGSTIGTLVTAPAHVELDARDLGDIRVDHTPASVRPAEPVMPAPHEEETASLAPAPLAAPAVDQGVPEPQAQVQALLPPPKTHAAVGTVAPPAPVWLTTPDAVAAAIAECGKNALAAQTGFSTSVSAQVSASLSLRVGDDGTVKAALFSPPLPPEARDCAANIIYKRTKLATTGNVTVPISIAPR